MQAVSLSKNVRVDFPPGPRPWDDLSRDVYCVLGVPIDAVDMSKVVRAVEDTVTNGASFLISTANLNFLVTSRRDSEFRETLLLSELCTADGMPIVWIARLLGLPITKRVAGSDMLDLLKARWSSVRQLNVFLFGGAEGVGNNAAKALNGTPGGLRCVGSIDPGFGTVEEMSQDHIIDAINASRADFLLVALGAVKGQQWLRRNHDRLQIPVRAHLGATINFVAGHIKRAPVPVRRSGLEWLWRIKEEPYLWRRYLNDGVIFIGLLATRVLPLAIRGQWRRFGKRACPDLIIETKRDREDIILIPRGAATADNADHAAVILREALSSQLRIRVNLAETCDIDARFLGLLLMLRKRGKREGADVEFFGASARLRRVFDLNGAGFLLVSDQR
jgi:N-acetylglucosaminyldiphosphoundecaprenol N-acetyl-beta-D-mannosaminyltransferase